MARSSSFMPVLLLLAGCSQVPAGSLLQLSRIDMNSTDMGLLRVALVAPDAVVFPPGDTKLDVRVVSKEQAMDMRQSFPLATDPHPVPPEISNALTAGDKVHFFRLSPDDAVAFSRIQKAVSDAKESGKSGSVEIGVGARGCLKHALSNPLRVSVFLRTSELNRYVIVVRDVDVKSLLSKGETVKELEPCKS